MNEKEGNKEKEKRKIEQGMLVMDEILKEFQILSNLVHKQKIYSICKFYYYWKCLIYYIHRLQL